MYSFLIGNVLNEGDIFTGSKDMSPLVDGVLTVSRGSLPVSKCMFSPSVTGVITAVTRSIHCN